MLASQAGRRGFNPGLPLFVSNPYSPTKYLVSKQFPFASNWTSNTASSWTSPLAVMGGRIWIASRSLFRLKNC
jgi:hypothetical protein